MVSMKDISAACGVSVATVSKALNNQSDINEETKKHIREVAKEMGYFPNAMARALKTNRTYNIGVLFTDEALSGLTHDFFAPILDSFKRTVEAKGYDITFLNRGSKGIGSMSYMEHCQYRGFDGVFMACTDFYDPQVLEVIRSDIPVVTVDHVFDNNIAIVSDNIGGMRSLTEYIHGFGHRRIAFIHGLRSSVTQARVSSFYRTMESFGLEVPQEYILEVPYRDTNAAAEATKELLDLKQPPTCIIYPDDFSCFGGMNAIRERGLRVPDDVSVAGYDGIRIGRHIEPRLTTLRQDTEMMGATAGEKLIGLIENPKMAAAEIITIAGSVYPGKTVTAPKQA